MRMPTMPFTRMAIPLRSTSTGEGYVRLLLKDAHHD